MVGKEMREKAFRNMKYWVSSSQALYIIGGGWEVWDERPASCLCGTNIPHSQNWLNTGILGKGTIG